MTLINQTKVLFGGLIAIAVLATGSYAFAKGADAADVSRDTAVSSASGSKRVAKATVRAASTVNAADVAAGTFGANVGNGDYAFPGSLGIGGAPASGYELDINPGGTNRFTVALNDGPVAVSLAGNQAGVFITDTNTGVSGMLRGSTFGNVFQFGVLNGDLRITTDGGEMHLDGTTGNVGIGAPATSNAKLDVAGMIRSSSGGFRFPDGTVQTTAAGGSRFDMVFASMPDRSACTPQSAGRFALDTSAEKLYVCLGSRWAAVQLEK